MLLMMNMSLGKVFTNMPLVSVVMSCYNHERFVSEAIESVLEQTFADFEFIIIDNGSKDSSPKIIKDYSRKDDRIKASFHAENMGIPKTYNELMDNATGKFIARIDSDDVWVKDKLEKQLEVMEQDDNLVVWTEAEIIDAESLFTGQRFTQLYESAEKNGQIFDELLSGNYVFCSSMMYKRENLDGVRYDENINYINDHKFNLDLAYRYEYYFIPEVLSKYRLHGENTIFSDRAGWNRDCMVLGKSLVQDYGDRFNSNENRKSLVQLVFGTPVYKMFEEDPWNKSNLIYLVVLPFYAVNLLIRNYVQQMGKTNK